jgi:hypothetical protein
VKTATQADQDRRLGNRCVRDRVSALRHLHHKARGLQVGLEHMGITSGPVTQEQIEFADAIREKMFEQLADCETFIGDAQICQILNASADSYPTAHVYLTDVLAPTGLVYFVNPIADPDIRATAEPRPPGADINCPIRAMSWSLLGLRESGPDQTDLPTGRVERSEWEREVIHAKGKFVLVITAYTDIGNIPNPDGVPRSKLPTIYPHSSVLWELDADDGGNMWGGTEAELARLGRAPYVKILMAYWAIMRQRLTQATRTVVRPHPREVPYKQGRPVDLNLAVHVVRLRPRTRYKYTEHDGANYNRPHWRVQWWVRSHWRRRVDHRTGETKPALMILSYRKGPDDKPMIGAERIYLPPKGLDE